MDSTREFSDMAQRLFGDLCGPREIEQAEDGRHPQVLWDAAMEAGLGVVLVDEGSGGVGGSLADAGAILRVAGGYAAPGPWLETMLGNQARVVAGLEPLDGPLALVFAPLGAATAPVDLRGVAWATTVAQVLVLSEQEGHAQLSVWTPEAFDVVPA